MAKYKKIDVNVPDLNMYFVSGSQNYSKPNIKAGNISVIKKINSDYRTLIEKWANVFEIEANISIAFIATESGGMMVRPNRYDATGLTQMTPGAVFESIAKWKPVVKSELPSAAVNFLNAKASFLTKLNANSPLMSSAKENQILTLLTDDTEFNIMVGAMYLRWLIEKLTYLNKVMVAYNAGPYLSALRDTAKIDSKALALNKSIPAESRAYILKMLGVDGYLDLIYKQKVI